MGRNSNRITSDGFALMVGILLASNWAFGASTELGEPLQTSLKTVTSIEGVEFKNDDFEDPRMKIQTKIDLKNSQNLALSTKRLSNQSYRLGVTKPFVAPAIIKDGKQILDSHAQVSVTGATFGYTDIPVHEVGWLSQLNLFDIQSATHVGLARFDMGFTYAFNETFAAFGGGNITSLFGAPGLNEVKPGLGLQAGINSQVSRRASVSVSLLQMSQTGPIGEVNLSGLEISLFAHL